ncbi:hypothetical protein FOXYSP1_08323 [Fusarium oxysporum f. sp. phaseoli]
MLIPITPSFSSISSSKESGPSIPPSRTSSTILDLSLISPSPETITTCLDGLALISGHHLARRTDTLTPDSRSTWNRITYQP